MALPGRTALYAGLLALIAVAGWTFGPAAAYHVQRTSAGDDIKFQHKGGNEWWVQVKVVVWDASMVWARHEDGTWHPLQLRSWGDWAGSFHVPPGERVQFHATRAGGMTDLYHATSCFFTHPAGVEQCDPGSTANLVVDFRSPSGNEWWQQVYADSNRVLTRVYVVIDDVDGARWSQLTKRSWGAWAGSFHAPPGTNVQFVATDDAETKESTCYRWGSITPTECPPDWGPNAPAPWQTRFDAKGGNEWWVEADVGPVEPDHVMVQDEGGPWMLMTLRDWGNWAASFRVEPGHKVRFQATFDDYPVAGETRTWESCWFTHPTGLSPDQLQICRGTELAFE